LSLFDLSSVVNALSTHTLTVTRDAANTYNSYGEAAARSTASTLTVKASIQPFDDKFAQTPDGPSDSQFVLAFSVTALAVRDRFPLSGLGTYEVQEVEPWGPSGNYYKSTCRRLDSEEPRA